MQKGILEETIEKRENFKNQFIEEARNELANSAARAITIR